MTAACTVRCQSRQIVDHPATAVFQNCWKLSYGIYQEGYLPIAVMVKSIFLWSQTTTVSNHSINQPEFCTVATNTTESWSTAIRREPEKEITITTDLTERTMDCIERYTDERQLNLHRRGVIYKRQGCKPVADFNIWPWNRSRSCKTTMPITPWMLNWFAYNSVKNGSSISNNFGLVHHWVVHATFYRFSHVKDSEIWNCRPWKSPSKSHILIVKIIKALNGCKLERNEPLRALMGHLVWTPALSLKEQRTKLRSPCIRQHYFLQTSDGGLWFAHHNCLPL